MRLIGQKPESDVSFIVFLKWGYPVYWGKLVLQSTFSFLKGVRTLYQLFSIMQAMQYQRTSSARYDVILYVTMF